MHLTPAQLTTLKNDILADATLNAIPNTADGAFTIAALYNVAASPSFYVWKTSVHRDEVGKAFVATALSAITAGNNDKLANFAVWNDVVNPSRSDQRQFFEDVFSVAAGASTRAALLALWKRLASRVEKLFANTAGGNGAEATPALMTFEGLLEYQDVIEARRL